MKIKTLRKWPPLALAVTALVWIGSTQTSSGQVLFNETFTGGAPVAGFTVVDDGNQTCTDSWVFNNPGGRAPGGGMDADFAIVDSDNYGNGCDISSSLVSPAFDASNLGAIYTLDFDLHYRALGDNFAGVEVWDGAVWNVVADYSGVSQGYPGAAIPVSIDITAATGNNAAAQVRFRYWDGGWNWWMAVDNISVTEVVPCAGMPAPGNTTGPSVACSGVDFGLGLEFATTGSGVSYQWYESTVSAAGPWTPVGVDADNHTGNIAATTWFYCEVTCSASAMTGSSAVLQVDLDVPSNCYCIPTWDPGVSNGCQDDDLIAHVVINTLDNMSGATCHSGAAGYDDYTDYLSGPNPEWTTDLAAGTSYDLDVAVGRWSEDVAVWIDFDDDGVFATPGERIGFANIPGSGVAGVVGPFTTFTVSLPCNPPVGEHRMRIRAVYEFETDPDLIDPCATHGQWGETEDYIVNVLPAPACPAPTGLAAGAVTQTTVDLSWIVGCLETAWEIEYGAPGFTPGTGTTQAAPTNPHTLTGLTGSTDYDIYVRADCGIDGLSTPFGPISVTTAPINDDCGGALIIACNSAVSGSTANTSNGDAPGACGLSDADNAGLWYTFTGTGNDMRLALCTSSFDSRVAVFSGACGAFVCEAGSDDDCGNDPDITFPTVNGTQYWAYIDGFGGATGDFYMELICLPQAGPCVDNELVLEINTDDFASETSWEVRPEGLITAVASGSGYSDFTQYFESFCVTDGCYDLEVFDSFGDGICCGFGEGNFTLRDGNGNRIIQSDGQYGDEAIVGRGFCVPIGNIALTIATCDRMDLTPSSIIVANEDPAVTAEYGVNDANSGYQFWIFDPNSPASGGYSRRIFLSHANPGTGGPPGATQAAHLQLHNVITDPIPATTFLNVRVRPRVNGANGEFGPMCTMMIDPAAAACPATQLDDNPLHVGTTFSCGVTDMNLDGSDKIWAEPVAGANRYQFEFRIDAEGYVRRIAFNTYVMTLVDTWLTNPLEYGKTYDVTVRASFDNGANWCPFGDVCQVSTAAAPPANASTRETTVVATVGLWPNPTSGDNVNLTIDQIATEYDEITVEIFDAFGKRVHSEVIANQGNSLNTILDLDGDLSNGIYVVNVNIGSEIVTERLIVQ